MVKLNSILREQNVTFVNNLDLYIQPGAYKSIQFINSCQNGHSLTYITDSCMRATP